MKFKEAIALLQKGEVTPEQGKELAVFFVDHVQDMNDSSDRSYQELQDSVSTLLDATGIEEGTLEQRLKLADSKVKDLSDRVETLTAQKTELEETINGKETTILKQQRQGVIRDAQMAIGFDGSVLQDLIGDDNELVYDSQSKSLNVDGVELKAWAEENKKSYIPVLFPKTENPEPQLPDGSSGGRDRSDSEAPTYINSRYNQSRVSEIISKY